MTKEQKAVRDWMIKFGQDAPDKPTIPDDKIVILRAKLIFEEALETILKGLGVEITIKSGYEHVGLTAEKIGRMDISFEKVKDVDLVETMDGISDIMVVSEGTAVALGIDSEPVHAEVLRSNDSKMWTQRETESANIPDHTITKVSEDERGYLVKNGAGKVIKSPSYSEAYILPIIKEQSK